MTRPLADPDSSNSCCDPCAVAGGAAQSDLRCACGSLLARRVDTGVELKCRRCKRTVVIPWEVDERA